MDIQRAWMYCGPERLWWPFLVSYIYEAIAHFYITHHFLILGRWDACFARCRLTAHHYRLSGTDRFKSPGIRRHCRQIRNRSGIVRIYLLFSYFGFTMSLLAFVIVWKPLGLRFGHYAQIAHYSTAKSTLMTWNVFSSACGNATHLEKSQITLHSGMTKNSCCTEDCVLKIDRFGNFRSIFRSLLCSFFLV